MPPVAAALANAPSKTRPAWVVKALLRSIFTRQFKGGDRLVEEEIALTLGVSRTPVREAFGQLAALGMIDLRPNHGAVVLPFGPPQMRELYHIRRLLESEASRLCAERIALDQVERLREDHQNLLAVQPRSPQWSAVVLALDDRFHELIANSSGNQRLADEIARYRELVDAIRAAVGNIAHAQDVALNEHLRVIDHLLLRQGDAAAEAMNRHIIRGTEAAVLALFPRPKQRAVAPSTEDDFRAPQDPLSRSAEVNPC